MIRQYRIGIGRLWHESNTFACYETDTTGFERYEGGLRIGGDVFNQTTRQDEITGMLSVFDKHSAFEVVPLLSASALPSGPLSPTAVEYLENALRTQLRKSAPLDGICFALHGAMNSKHIPDLDGYFLDLLREETNDTIPLIASLDCHAIVTQRMVDSADALIAYRTHPHTDLVETGARAARMLRDMLIQKAKPTMAWVKVPMMFPPPDDGTRAGAMKTLFDQVARHDDTPGVLACSFCPGFPWQDTSEQGAAAITVTNQDAPLAARLANQLADEAWQARAQLEPQIMHAPMEAMNLVKSIAETPVIIIDSADTVGAGAPGDNTVMLESLLKHRQTIEGLIATHLPSPRAIQTLSSYEIGAPVTVAVGGENDRRFCEPLTVTGKLMAFEDGPVTDDGRFGTEPYVSTGRIACLAIDNVRLVLTEQIMMGPQPSLYRKVGIEPTNTRLIALKTGVGYKASFGNITQHVIRLDCPGASSYALTRFDYTSIEYSVYPLDRTMTWQASLGTTNNKDFNQPTKL